MAEIIDGKKIAQQIQQELAEEVLQLKLKYQEIPHLSVVLVGENPASVIYVRNKTKACEAVGMSSETISLPENVSEEKLFSVIRELNTNPKVHAILVQLPLPAHISEARVLATIAPEKDVDGLHPMNFGKLVVGDPSGFVPCTPAGVLELLMRSGHAPAEKRVTIIGRSHLVGMPLGLLLLRKGKAGDATVTICHSKTQDLSISTRDADIVIVAVGSPNTLTKSMVKPGVVVIDVGTNRIPDPSKPSGSRLVGDVDFAGVSEVASAITPVPGGVGPMTIAMLLKNTVKAFVLQKKE